jgi:threonine dehydratase
VIEMEAGAFGLDCRLALKLESLQLTGAFKARGAFNFILSHDVPGSGVIAASGGNHGVAVATAAKTLGYRAEIFVPEVVSPVKRERLIALGANVHVTGANYGEALAASRSRAAETGALVVHAYDMEAVIAGQGTIGRELASQLGSIETLLVAVGGGGLISGIASWFQGSIRIVAVEPALCPTLHEALRAGRPVDVSVGGIAADSLGATRLGELAFPICQRFVSQSLLVEDSAIDAARKALWDALRLVTEPGGAAAMAALSSGAYQPRLGERVCVIICGANTDLHTFPA